MPCGRLFSPVRPRLRSPALRLPTRSRVPAGRDGAQRWRPSAEDISAFGDARIAALHAGLKLTAEQEKNWPAVESALRDLAKQRSERFAARASADRPKDPIERLALRADVMSQRGAALKKVADAAGPLYKSLDEAQKHRFIVLARLGGAISAASAACTGSAAGCIAARAALGAARWGPMAVRGRSKSPQREAGRRPKRLPDA